MRVLRLGEEFNESAKANETVIGFKNTKDNAAFVNANSAQKFNDTYVFRSAFSSDQADNITALKTGEIYGPYKDNGFYKLTKIIDDSRFVISELDAGSLERVTYYFL